MVLLWFNNSVRLTALKLVMLVVVEVLIRRGRKV